MRVITASGLIALASVIFDSAAQNTATGTSAVEAAAATALTLSPTSCVKGKAFDRVAIFWLENTDATEAYDDPNLKYLQSKGITLTNYNAVTHPSEPNYISSSGGDYFGLNGDGFVQVPANVSTIVDLLEEGGISWAAYQEDIPYSGFEGFSWTTGAQKSDYVRKHNPFVIYDSIANQKEGLAVIKNFTLFYEDLENNSLPQYIFITPNMTNDGHDTNVTFAGKWARDFTDPLLSNENFTQNTLILLTFDEDETYTERNTVYALLLGDAIPEQLRGTTDDTYYNHYSEIATVEWNWDTCTLGRWDVGANVFKFGPSEGDCDAPRAWQGSPSFEEMYFNASYPGPLNNKKNHTAWPAPNVSLERCGRSVLQSVVDTWKDSQQDTYYTGALEIPDGAHPPTYQSKPAV